MCLILGGFLTCFYRSLVWGFLEKREWQNQHAVNSAWIIIITNVPIKIHYFKLYLTFLLLKTNSILMAFCWYWFKCNHLHLTKFVELGPFGSRYPIQDTLAFSRWVGCEKLFQEMCLISSHDAWPFRVFHRNATTNTI
jgi:hypothetical protein